MMMRPTTSPPRIIHLVMIAFAAGTVPVDAKTGHNVATLQEAVRTYDAAMVPMDPEARGEAFRRAGRLFTRVIKTAEVRNASLYVNLGNATLQANEPGRAILAYRRALELQPGHAQALRNLEHARGTNRGDPQLAAALDPILRGGDHSRLDRVHRDRRMAGSPGAVRGGRGHRPTGDRPQRRFQRRAATLCRSFACRRRGLRGCPS